MGARRLDATCGAREQRAASRERSRPAAARSAASYSIAGALHAAERLPGPAARVFTLTAQTAFIDGIRVAALFGVGLAVVAAILTTRYLPRVHAAPQKLRSRNYVHVFAPTLKR